MSVLSLPDSFRFCPRPCLQHYRFPSGTGPFWCVWYETGVLCFGGLGVPRWSGAPGPCLSLGGLVAGAYSAGMGKGAFLCSGSRLSCLYGCRNRRQLSILRPLDWSRSACRPPVRRGSPADCLSLGLGRGRFSCSQPASGPFGVNRSCSISTCHCSVVRPRHGAVRGRWWTGTHLLP